MGEVQHIPTLPKAKQEVVGTEPAEEAATIIEGPTIEVAEVATIIPTSQRNQVWLERALN